MTVPFSDPLPPGWEMVLHPEGKRYFVYDAGEDMVGLILDIIQNYSHRLAP